MRSRRWWSERTSSVRLVSSSSSMKNAAMFAVMKDTTPMLVTMSTTAVALPPRGGRGQVAVPYGGESHDHPPQTVDQRVALEEGEQPSCR